jgi:hypothetical protein
MNVDIKHIKKGINEGRLVEMEFSFLEKQKTKFVTTMPFTTCKDFLNEKVFAEKYKKELIKIYGFSASYKKLFENKNCYLGFKIRDEEKLNHELLINNSENILYLINHIEELFEFKSKSSLIVTSTNQKIPKTVFILDLEPTWVTSTFLISMLSYLIRIGFELKTKKNIFEIKVDDIKSNTKKLTLSSFKARIEILVKNKNIDDKFINEESKAHDVHTKGFFRLITLSPYNKTNEDEIKLTTLYDKDKNRNPFKIEKITVQKFNLLKEIKNIF